MSSWLSNITWDSSAIGGMTTAAPTTAAPTTAAPATTVTPATVAPSYPYNPNYGSGGGVIFPLPVAPSLLMDGDITSLNPLTPMPTTMAPTTLPPTLAPVPTFTPQPDEEEPEPFWTFNTILLMSCLCVLLLAAVWFFFFRKGGKNKNNNRGKNNSNIGPKGAANYNNALDNWNNLNTNLNAGNNRR